MDASRDVGLIRDHDVMVTNRERAVGQSLRASSSLSSTPLL